MHGDTGRTWSLSAVLSAFRPARSKDTITADLRRQAAGPERSVEEAPSRAAAALRAGATARGVVRRRVGRVFRAVRRVERTVLAADRLRGSVYHRLASHKMQAERVKINNEDESRLGLSWIGSWVSVGLVILLGLFFVVNDATFIVTTGRVLLDVPESVETFDLSDRNNLFALAMAGFVTLLLFLVVVVGSNTLARLAAPSSAKRSSEAEDGSSPRAGLRRHIATTPFIVLTLLIVGGVSVFLHRIAHARFEGQLFASSASDASGIYTWAVTSLPAAMLIAAFVAETPRFVQVRKIQRAMLRHRIYEWWTVRRERRLARRYLKQYVRAERAMAALHDALEDVGLRADYDLVQAAIETGMISIGEPPQPDQAGGDGAYESRKIYFPGRPSTRHLGGLPGTAQIVRVMVHRFNMLPAPDHFDDVERLWQSFKADPSNFISTPKSASDTKTPRTVGNGLREFVPIDRIDGGRGTNSAVIHTDGEGQS